MAKKAEKKTMEQLLAEPCEVVINQAHVDDWHFCNSSAPFERLKDLLPYNNQGGFNIMAGISSPKSIRYRQRATDFDDGTIGDYTFADRSGGKMTVPYKLFKLLF